MQIIPVLDLMGGVVVHARQGARDEYRPVRSLLTPSSQPLVIAAALLGLAQFRTLYIADLDAIRGQGDHRATVAKLMERFPGVEVWLDDGGLAPAPRPCGVVPVIGTESLPDLRTARRALAKGDAVLSLDYGPEGPLGPAEIHAEASLWPERVIVMPLRKVGSGEGPDLPLLQSILDRAGGRRVYAAGGVRGAGDLEELRSAGAAGVLVASALHDSRLSAGALAAFA